MWRNKRGRRNIVNTDQVFELLQDAGVSESTSIQTVRRWLREGKIKYEGGKRSRETVCIIDDTDQAFDLLKDAGVSESISNQIVRRWLHEGRIKYEGSRNKKTDYIVDDTTSKLFIDDCTNQNMDEMIHRLTLKIQAQEKHIEGLEELHENAKHRIIEQRDKLKKEVATLKNKENKLQSEIRNLVKQNIELRNELKKLKESKGDHYTLTSSTQLNNYSKKLGLSKMASNKEVLAEYKGLLKITHPDQGGNAKLFHYIKTDYDNFRNSTKDK